MLVILATLFVTAPIVAQDREDYRSAGEENWVRLRFEIRDAQTGEPIKGRIFYQSDAAADWFHPDNTQPLLPPGTYRVVAWERTYWQTEETLVVDPRNGLRQTHGMTLRMAAPKRNDASRHVPEILSGLVVVGNAVQKMPHLNTSSFSHTGIGNVAVHWSAWSEFPGGIGGSSNISSSNARIEIYHDATAAKQRFETYRPYFKLNPSKGDRFSGPVQTALGDESIMYSVDRPRQDGGPGNANELRKFLIRTDNVVMEFNTNRQLTAPFISSAPEMLGRIRSLDMQQVKRLLEPEPFPWPKIQSRPGSSQTAQRPPPSPTADTNVPDETTPQSDTPEETPTDAEQPVDATDLADAVPELTPAEIAAVSGLAGGSALLGSLLLLGASGVRRDEVLESIRELLRGRLPEDPFEAWKRKYEALGWRYSETGGVATFDPVDGARNEAGEVFSSATGRFEPAGGTPVHVLATPHDGDVNDCGEVWSDYSRGWVGRATYEQDQAQQAWLADKARRDLADMQRPDADVADLHRRIAETRREGQAMETFFDARQKLSDALEQQRQREFADGALGATRTGLFDDIDRRLDDMATRRDFKSGLGDMASLADMIGQQMRDTYKPTYTYQDAVLDTALQTGALAADVFVTRGFASSALGSTLAMRDAVREGADTTGMLLAGAKAAATDYLFGKAAHLGGTYAMEAWNAYGRDAWNATRRAAGGLADEVASMAGGFRRSAVAGDLVEQAKRNLDTLEAGVHRDASGRMRASLSDVLDVQRNPNQVRLLKQQGSLQTQEAFNHTLRNEVYKPHDQMLLERLRQSNPELADKKLMVHEFRTPGKTANPINTDRDFRVLVQDDAGKWIEVPKAKWEHHSNDVFGDLTLFDPAKCPKGMNPAEQKAWWAEQHGHTPTDRAFREASRDYSDQAIDAFGRRTQIGTPRIAELKDIASGRIAPPAQPMKLADPQALAQQFHEKVTGNLRRGDPFEAIAQAKKGVETLDAVRKAYDVQKLPIGDMPANLRGAMDAVARSNLPAHADAAALAAFEDTLRSHGFRSLEDFSGKLSSQFEALKWAK